MPLIKQVLRYRKRAKSAASEQGKRIALNSFEKDTENSKSNIKPKVTISFALDGPVVEELRNEAQGANKSLNIRVNEILKKYVEYYRMVEQARSAILTPSTFQFIVDSLDESMLTDEMRRVAVDFIPSVYSQRNIPVTLDSIVKFTFEHVCVNGGSIRTVEKTRDLQDGKIRLFFVHDYNIKWSRILSKALALQIETMLHCHTRTKVFSNSFEIKILDDGNF